MDGCPSPVRSASGILARWLAAGQFALAGLLAALAPVTAADVDVHGQVRARQLVLLNGDFDAQSGSPDNYGLLRATVSLRAQATDAASAFIELRDSRAFGEARSTTTSLEQVDAHQAYVQVDRLGGRPLRLRVGRMELTYGRQRLLGNHDWDNVGRSFDGLELRNDLAGFGWFDVFAFKTLETGGIPPGVNDGANAAGDKEQALVGAYIRYDTGEDGCLEAYALDLYDDLGQLDPDPSSTGDERDARANRFTVGMRFEQQLLDRRLQLFGEGAWQFGSASDRIDTTAGAILDGADIAAWAVMAGVDCAFNAPLAPWIGVELNLASGDDGTDRTQQRTFDQLFPSSHAPLGIFDLVGWQNVRSLKGTLGTRPAEPWRIFASAHRFHVDAPADAWYRADGTVVLGGDAAFDDHLGDELDLTLRYAPQRELLFELNWSTWLPGAWQEAATAAAAGDSPAASLAALDPAHLVTMTLSIGF